MYHPHGTIGATEAFRLGLVEKVVLPGQVMEAALELAGHAPVTQSKL